MELADWLKGKGPRLTGILHVIGTCGDCEVIKHCSTVRRLEDHIDIMDFGCIHFEQKEVADDG